MGLFSWRSTPQTGPNADATSPAVGLASPWTTQELQRVVYSELFDAANLPITRAQAVSVPAVARGRDLICNTLAGLSLVAVDYDGNERSGSNSATFCAQPDPTFSRFVTVQWTLDDLVFFGVAWWRVTARWALDNRPRTIERIHPGRLAFQDGGVVTVDNAPTDPADLVRFDGPHEGLLARGATTIRQAIALERAASSFAAQPVHLVEVHQTDDTALTPAQIKDLTDAYNTALAAKSVIYSPSNIELKVTSGATPDLFTEGRNAASVNVARLLGLPATLLDATSGDSQTYSNVAQKNQAAIDYGLRPYASAIEERLSLPDITPAGTWIRFRFDELTAASDANPTTPPPPPGAPA